MSMQMFTHRDHPGVVLIVHDGGDGGMSRYSRPFAEVDEVDFVVDQGWDEITLPAYCAGEDW